MSQPPLLPVGWADWNPCCGWLFCLVWCCLFLSQDQSSLHVSLKTSHLPWPSMKRCCRVHFWGHISWLPSYVCLLLCLVFFSRIERPIFSLLLLWAEINVWQVKCFQRNHALLEQRIPVSDFRFFSSNFCLPPVLGQGPNGYVYMQIMQVIPLMAALLVGKPSGSPLKGLAQFFSLCADCFGPSKRSLMKTLNLANREANIADHLGTFYGATFKVHIFLRWTNTQIFRNAGIGRASFHFLVSDSQIKVCTRMTHKTC